MSEVNTTLTLKNVRLSWPSLFRPEASDLGGEPKYNVKLLIDKDDKATVARINKAIDAFTQQQLAAGTFGPKAKKSQLLMPLHDGDDSNAEYEEGYWTMRASSKYQPLVVDRNHEEIIDESEVYAGCYADVNVNFYAFNNKAKGVSCGLNGVKKTKDGERFSGGARSADAMFGEADDDDETGGGLLD